MIIKKKLNKMVNYKCSKTFDDKNPIEREGILIKIVSPYFIIIDTDINKYLYKKYRETYEHIPQ